MSKKLKQDGLLTWIWRQCGRIPKDLDGFQSNDQYFRIGPEDGMVLFNSAVKQYGRSKVEAAGLGVFIGTSRVRLAAPLKSAGEVLVAFRKSPTSVPYEILSNSGGLFKKQLPVRSALSDRRTRKRIAESAFRLFVCQSTEQLRILDSLDLPATLTHGIVKLRASGLKCLAKEFGWTTNKSRLGTGPIHLVLVDWDPATWRPIACLQARETAAFLAKAQQNFHCKTFHCSVWSPPASEIDAIRFCMEMGDHDTARESLLESVDSSIFAINAFSDPDFDPRRKISNYLEALTELQAAYAEDEHMPGIIQRRKQAQHVFERMVQQDLITPQIEQSLAVSCPQARNAGVLIAESFRSLHLFTPAMLRSIRTLNSSSHDAQEGRYAREMCTYRGRLFSELMRQLKAMQS